MLINKDRFSEIPDELLGQICIILDCKEVYLKLHILSKLWSNFLTHQNKSNKTIYTQSLNFFCYYNKKHFKTGKTSSSILSELKYTKFSYLLHLSLEFSFDRDNNIVSNLQNLYTPVLQSLVIKEFRFAFTSAKLVKQMQINVGNKISLFVNKFKSIKTFRIEHFVSNIIPDFNDCIEELIFNRNLCIINNSFEQEYYLELNDVTNLPDKLKRLEYHGYTDLVLSSFPQTLTNLNCALNNLKMLPILPESLITLNCSGNHLKEITHLPSNLKELLCSANHLDFIKYLPESLIFLDCSFNYLVELPSFPVTLHKIVCNCNFLKKLPTLPFNLNILKCNENSFVEVPKLFANLNILVCDA